LNTLSTDFEEVNVQPDTSCNEWAVGRECLVLYVCICTRECYLKQTDVNVYLFQMALINCLIVSSFLFVHKVI